MKSTFLRPAAAIFAAVMVCFCTAIAFGQSDGSQVTSNETLSPEKRLELGKRDFGVYCAPCHGATGMGDGPVAVELVNKPVNLTELSKNADGKFPEEKIKMLVDGRDMPRAHGTSEMPVWGVWFSAAANAAGLLQDDISTTEAVVQARIERLIEYLKTIQK
ncbi:MAG: c-type cytochrome [Hyphomicrobiales bacterium]